MHNLATVILPSSVKRPPNEIQSLNDVLMSILERHYKIDHPNFNNECDCKILKAKAHTFSYFKEKLSVLSEAWRSLSDQEKITTTIQRIDPKLNQIVQGYYKTLLPITSFDHNCVKCNGSGQRSLNNLGWKSLQRFYYQQEDKFWNKNPEYPSGFEKVKNINRASSLLILPDGTLVEKPISSIFQYGLEDISEEEWNNKVFFEKISPYSNNFAALVLFV